MSDFEFAISLMFFSGALLGFIASIIKGFKEGGIKEVFENLFLFFLLFAGFSFITTPPVENIDELTAAAFFATFGVCRIAKSIAKQNGKTDNEIN